ncbi:hypothetical protein LSAT2_013750, partial [Lamellibrachia satsuma]
MRHCDRHMTIYSTTCRHRLAYTSTPCSVHVVAMSRHSVAYMSPCGIHVTAVSRTCHSRVAYMSPPCRGPVTAVSLSVPAGDSHRTVPAPACRLTHDIPEMVAFGEDTNNTFALICYVQLLASSNDSWTIRLTTPRH